MNLYDSSTYREDLTAAINATVRIGSLKEQSVLVTGATGTIGSFLVDLLLHYNQTAHANIRIYASGRSRERLEKRFDAVRTDHLFYVPHDLLQPVSFDFPVDYVIHAAGNAYPAAFSSDPVGTIIGNISGTYAMLEFARHHGAKRLLYVSSGEVYGQGDITLDEFEESYGGYVDPTSPRSCYPNSKRTAETLCASYSKQFGLETVIVRPCHTYGPGITETDNRANVQFVNNVLNQEDIVMKSAGTQMRSYCYIADCASAILTVLLNGQSGEAYNSANPDARTTIAGFAQAIAEAAGRNVIFENPTQNDIEQRTPIAKQVLSSKKLETLGWQGQYGISEGVRHMLKILQET